MFIDLEEYTGPVDVQTDVCIVGAGAAGITLAMEFDGTATEVCVLESGRFRHDATTQALADGDNVGLPYYELITSRLRFFGGTTNHWGGICRPLDALDFQKRDELPYSGWPIDRALLDRYYERAHFYCQLGSYNYDVDYWAGPDAPLLPHGGGQLATKLILQQPLRFGLAYREKLGSSRNIRIFLSANATDFIASGNGRYISEVRARSLGGKTMSISPRTVILAGGGIENARLLLASNRFHPNGIGNDGDLVGRFFMEHPQAPTMEVQLAHRYNNLSLYTGANRRGLGVTGYLTLDDETLKREGMLNAAGRLSFGGADQPIAKSSKGIASLVEIWNGLKRGDAAPNFGRHVRNILSDLEQVIIYSYEQSFVASTGLAHLYLQIEQAPNPSSRVLLADETDELGMRKARLDWRMGDLERHTFSRFGEVLGRELGRLGLGRVRLLPPTEDGWWPGMRGSWHHMGTTRMHSDARQGVVDANCRVHTVENLYVSGSSVFTTSGFANPTLTIVALAIRLADHLKRVES